MGRKNKKNKKEEEDQLVDIREPKIRSSFILWWYLLPESVLVICGVIGASISASLPLVITVVQGELLDGLMPSAASALPSSSKIITNAVYQKQKAILMTNVSRAAMYMAFIAVAAFVGDFVQTFFMNLANDRIGNKVRKVYLDSLLDQEIGYFDIKKTGQLVTDMTDTKMIQDAYSTKLGDIAKGVVEAILGIALGIRASWKMALVMCSVGPLLMGFFLATAPLITYPVERSKKILGEASSIANEILGAMRTVRSMDGEEKEKSRYLKQLRKANLWFNLQACSNGFVMGMFEFLIWGAVALSFWYGGLLVVRKEISVGDMFQVFGLTLMGVIGALMVLTHLPAVTKAIPQVYNMLKVIRRIPALPTEGGITPNKIVGSIEFKDVCFTYPSRPGTAVLRDFTLAVQPGQVVALVGASGSGKSTIVGLIEKFYTPDSGDILLDGINLSEIDPRWLHRNIGIVTQEPTLFSGTIKSNIAYAVSGLKQITDDDIQQAAIAANAHEFISALPQGYETVIGEKGVSLSGGQKQRIAIARAVIQNPSLLLLDEATSALDTQSESIVQDALTKLMKGRTSIVIAHRLTTIVHSDLICVMNQGKLKEKGTHDELLQIPDGYYSRLCKRQMVTAS